MKSTKNLPFKVFIMPKDFYSTEKPSKDYFIILFIFTYSLFLYLNLISQSQLCNEGIKKDYIFSWKHLKNSRKYLFFNTLIVTKIKTTDSFENFIRKIDEMFFGLTTFWVKIIKKMHQQHQRIKLVAMRRAILVFVFKISSFADSW